MDALIGEKTITRTDEKIEGMLRYYQREINIAYEDGGEIKISMPVAIKRKGGANNIKVGISFVTEKIEDSATDDVDELQMSFDIDKMVKCPLNGDIEMKEEDCPDNCKKRAIMFVDGQFPAIPLPQVSDQPSESVCIQYLTCRRWADHFTRAFIKELLESAKARECSPI